jgi:hypothetical protein
VWGLANVLPFPLYEQEMPMAALPFNSAEIEKLVLRFNASDDEVAANLQETAGDLSRDEIRQEIGGMNNEQQDGLVALFWIGRGDAEPEAWEQTKVLARQQHAGSVSRYFLGQPEVGEFLAEGLERMLEYGVD